ncbi:MAG: isoleucine--tRNA ligase [Deltaproteobacteria bacterium]|nr:MAG: isoleucine--tRNA ligase [Deltaproteobacteria bacterium]
MDYRDTLNLPQTSFKMKANLSQKEPQFLKRWSKEQLYQQIQEDAKERPRYILHDGPPYANGNIHLGTAFNKILKDIILKSKRLAGFNAPYIPGWDCHGLPIEHNVDKELGDKKKTIPILSKRNACRKYAEKYIKIQKAEFERLGVLGDWEEPYLTMNFPYEAAIAREFNKFLMSGSVIRNKKPVYWCSTCTTALAEAEVEYHDHVSPSIYVKFKVKDDLAAIDPSLTGDQVYVVIWTTTPWTLPANMGIAFHPDFVYVSVQVGGEVWILAKELAEQVMEQCGVQDYTILAEFSAAGLEGKNCRHPFMNRDSLIVLADYVTADAGTGCVHTAPGHGADDYLTGLKYGLEIMSPLDDEGIYTHEAGKYEGRAIPAVNSDITADMAASGELIHEDKINHSYPHCWRCKKPVIYRATPQWFLSMEKNELRRKTLAEIEKVTWTPAWGQQRIYAMIEGRPDWCLSRQRSWGVPITVISCKNCGQVVRDQQVNQKIDELFLQEGADAWFKHEAADFLPDGYLCPDCEKHDFIKENDILDVWFDSGTSHAAVMEEREELGSPADLYLEGSDQHRGWFHSSILTSVGTRDRAPYHGVLTHGYVVDGQGKKMSKSVGNVVAPGEVIEKYGAEILRLWVSSEDYRDDVKVSDEILKQVSDSYRKIRNTIRYMLGNLSDFNPETDAVAYEELAELDQWALTKYYQFAEKVMAAYDRFEFHSINQGLNYFCGTTMSAFYLDIIKDRLYTEGKKSLPRRAAQTILHTILSGMLRLMMPILSFTAAEAWDSLYGLDENSPVSAGIFFARFPEISDRKMSAELLDKWQKLLKIRSDLTRALEIARSNKVIGHSLEADVFLDYDDSLREFIEAEWHTLKEISIISGLKKMDGQALEGERYLSEDFENFVILVRPAAGGKCERCWTRSDTVGQAAEHPQICKRCLDVISQINLAG